MNKENKPNNTKSIDMRKTNCILDKILSFINDRLSVIFILIRGLVDRFFRFGYFF